MAKFRHHDTTLARQETEGHRQAASAKYPPRSNEWFAELQLLRLQDTADKGLWSCYESFERSLADFYADFSWDGRMPSQIEIMLADPRLPEIVGTIKAAHGFDLEAELRQALKDPDRADSDKPRSPATVLLRSYSPLCPGRAGAVEALDPAEVNRLVQEQQERYPSGQALACVWLDYQGKPTPVFVLEQGRDIAAHLVHWCEGHPPEWFKLHVVGVGQRYALALVPDLEQVVERWRLAYLETHGEWPAPETRYSVYFRPLHFLAEGAGVYAQVKGRLGASSYLGLLDASNFDLANPGAVDASAVTFVGPFELGHDPTRHLAGLFSSLIQSPPALPDE
jgi:hypothetical protein